jgi:NAD(P)-dependent dehydrogenase (short-subunit alcohol dehydrogenase family)
MPRPAPVVPSQAPPRVRKAAELGARLAVADRDPEAAALTVDAVRAAGGSAVARIGDASLEADMERIVAESAAELGGIDGLVVNLGIAAGIGLAGTAAETWDAVMAVNARAHSSAASSPCR